MCPARGATSGVLTATASRAGRVYHALEMFDQFVDKLVRAFADGVGETSDDVSDARDEVSETATGARVIWYGTCV